MLDIASNYNGVLFSFLVLMLLALVVTLGTPFLFISTTLSLLRVAIGAPQTPPNFVIYGLAFLMTLITMKPVLLSSYEELNENVYEIESAYSLFEKYESVNNALVSYRSYLDRSINGQYIKSFSSDKCMESGDCMLHELVPNYTLKELKRAFKVGFEIFIPFILIDFVVSLVLLALGMMMMPPTSFSLPLKLIFFYYMNGWELIFNAYYNAGF